MEQKMDMQLRCYDKVIQLINKGVEIQNPITIDLGEEDSERGESQSCHRSTYLINDFFKIIIKEEILWVNFLVLTVLEEKQTAIQ